MKTYRLTYRLEGRRVTTFVRASSQKDAKSQAPKEATHKKASVFEK
jgi:hypothetical protein